jgi:polysaccharide export outer membrane protein
MNRSIAGLLLSTLAGTTFTSPSWAETPTPPGATPQAEFPYSITAPAINPPSQPVRTAPNPAVPQPNAPLNAPLNTPIQSLPLPSNPQVLPYSSAAGGAYSLGAGDLIKVDIFDTPELTLEPRYSVLLDGSVNLPWIGNVNVQGLTLEAAQVELARRYSRFIRNPQITVSIIAPRPLKIGVIGEVNRPGSYIISVISNESSIANLTQRSGSEGGSQWPTVSKAVQTAGGITLQANIREIQLRRPRGPGLEDEIINVDLWKFLKEGDLAQDRILRDGDTIVIQTATQLDAEQTTRVAVSNFSPAEIKINVVGEVEQPGVVTIRPNSTLNQALLAAGGLRNKRARKDVELIRLNPDGSVARRPIRIDLSKGLDEQENPALRDNDIIVVRRNGLTEVVDTLGIVLTPLTSGVFGILRTFGIGP